MKRSRRRRGGNAQAGRGAKVELRCRDPAGLIPVHRDQLRGAACPVHQPPPLPQTAGQTDVKISSGRINTHSHANTHTQRHIYVIPGPVNVTLENQSADAMKSCAFRWALNPTTRVPIRD